MKESKVTYEDPRYELAINAVNDGIFDYDLITNQVYYSPGWKKLIGYKPDEFNDDVSAFAKLIDKESTEKCLAMKDDALHNFKTDFSYEIKMRHKNGHWIDILVRAKVIPRKDGRPLRIIGTHTDISAQKNIEKELHEKTIALARLLEKSEKQRIANLVILNDLNSTSKKLKLEIREHKKSEKELKKNQLHLRNLSHHLQNAREDQSAYIAREIHDDLGQELTALEMILTLFEEELDKQKIDDCRIAEFRQELRTQLNSVVEKSRNLTLDLRPAVMDTYDLTGALNWLTGEFRKHSKINIEQDFLKKEIDLGDKRNLAVFRIMQEAYNNIAKHSRADNVSVTISEKKSNLYITVRDDGKGFNPKEGRKQTSFGLMNMQERAFYCGGTIEINSKKGEGTLLSIKIPLEEKK